MMNTDVLKVLWRVWRNSAAPAAGICWAFCIGIFSTAWQVSAVETQPVTAESGPRITLSAAEVETGGTLIVRIDCRRMPASAREPVVSFGDQVTPLFPHPAEAKGVYAGLVGIALAARPGPAALKVEWSAGTQRRSTSAAFVIRSGIYGEETLKVDPRHVRPSPQDLERIRREQAELKQIYASGSRFRLWLGAFLVPVAGEMNGPFGTRRLFNGELQSQHTGVDFRAQTGDPVQAAGSGVVRLAKDLFFSGNAVILDHGAGVFTSYSHLSRMEVAVGQQIEKGKVVGMAGATGRATGPHLHWAVKVNSVNVNPLTFIQVMEMLGGG
jgi:murein DD-endopeptidase MepM/ murein hydrolase activator NlpD